LLNEQGDLIKTTTSDAQGNYIFSNIMPGHYLVQVKEVFGYDFSSLNKSDQSGFTTTGQMEVKLGFAENLHLGNAVLIPKD